LQSDYLGFRGLISIDTKIFEYTFSGAEPIGSYQIGGRLLFSGKLGVGQIYLGHCPKQLLIFCT